MPIPTSLTILVSLIACCSLGGAALADPPHPSGQAIESNRGPVAHWPLAGDERDHSGNNRHAIGHGGIDLKAAGPTGKSGAAAAFNGRDAYLEVPATTAPRLGTGDFSISAWVHTDDATDDVPGDIISQYDPASRRGFHVSLKTSAGVATAQANFRHLQFGIDAGRESIWTDCGRPGQAILAFALVAHDGQLFAGTCEPGENAAGRVYRHGGGSQWIDCGSPTAANAVTAMAAFDSRLYAGTGKYRLGGSALEESKNPNLGGRVLVYDGEKSWTDCGQLPGVEAVGGLVVFRGQLYATSLYRPAGFFRYDGGTTWTDCGTPGKRVEALAVYNGHLYATSYDGGHVFRYDGNSWVDCGQLGQAEGNTQTYSFAVYHGRLYVGTWRTGRVYRFEDVDRWTDVGRLGEELEVMGMLVHNGRLLAGSLPLAEVYQYEGDTAWHRMTRLDMTPDVTYRRAWTMAEHDGRVFVSTLPSGRVHSFAAGTSVAWEHSFPAGWRHVAAIRGGGRLRLFADGHLVGRSQPFNVADYDLSIEAPLRIGLGSNDYFLGRMRDVRLYGRALGDEEIAALAKAK